MLRIMSLPLRNTRPRRSFIFSALLALICHQAFQMSKTFFLGSETSEQDNLSDLPILVANSSKNFPKDIALNARNNGANQHNREINSREDDNQKDASPKATTNVSLRLLNITTSSNTSQCWNPKIQCEMLQDRILAGETGISKYKNISTYALNAPLAREGKRTLALADPALRDGYRNQFMRFVSFTAYALTNGFQQMLLPSIRWSCDHRRLRAPSVPFELLFDVDHWNNDTDLPRLVEYNESEHLDWDPFTGLFHGACDVLRMYINRGAGFKDVILARVRHYQHPVPHGGGNTLGTLFYDYVNFDAKRPKIFLKEQNITTTFHKLEEKITRALKPSAMLERLTRETLKNNNNNNGGQPPYLVLHARVEPEMLNHVACRRMKVYNLTDVFDMIRGMNHSEISTNPFMYIAIGMNEMTEYNRYQSFHLEHRLNMAALQHVASYGFDLPSLEKNLTVTVGGDAAVRSSSELEACTHEIVSSVISFEIAIRAKIFIGTRISSWSTTVWKTRYYLGRGENYAYTPNGLEKIEGVPKPFRC